MWLKNILLFFCFQLAFTQNQQPSLEDKIYNSIDTFVAHPTEENLKKLTAEAASFHPKSKSEWLAIVILNCNRAYYQNAFGQTQKAIESYEKAWQWFEKNKLSNYDIVESCLQPLGNLYTIIGDYENAENTIKQYYYIANVERNQSHKFAAILNLSNVYHYSGKNTEAIYLLEKTIASENLTPLQKGLLWNNLGNNYLSTNRSDKAVTCYEISIQLLKNSNENESLSNAYRNLALLNNDLLVFNKAKQSFVKSNNNSPRSIAKLYYDEAFLYYQNNHLTETQVALRTVFTTLLPKYSISSLPKKELLYAETTLLDAFDLQAALFISQNQPKKALEWYQLAFHIDALLQSFLVYENSKIITQIRIHNRIEKCIQIYHSLYLKEKKATYLESAFLLSEQNKSAVLKQSLLDAKKQSREEKRIVQQLQNWNTVIVKEQQKLQKADISKINEAIKKQNVLMLLLKSKTTKSSEAQDLNLPNLYSKLEKEKALLVSYFVGKNYLYSFTVENHSIQLKILSEKWDENSLIRSYLSLFKDANLIADNPIKFNHLAKLTYDFLQLPKPKSNKNLIIIPDGILNFLPFEALITKETTSNNFSKMQYLLYDFTIGYSNSTDFYLNAIPFQHKKETVLGVFPLFENTSLELTFSKKELENLKANYNGKYIDRQNATFGKFKQNATNYSILHLSTHASSGDIFEPASIKFYDQEVLYSELYHLDIHPDLVVLSACETGLGKLYKAEGAMSVARGFQFAGARNLLFSLWKVNDYTTSVVMEKFYANVKEGDSYFDANHQAKLEFLADESISNAKKSPYYWSAFVYYGTLEKKDSSHYVVWISVFIGLIALFFIFKIVTQRYAKKQGDSQ